jgi:parvulin-like peptidyl-prolyl isomerase
MMVPAFDSASFAMEVGEVSDLIESEFGLHVIRLEERSSPAFDEIGPDYRQQVLSDWVLEAETFFLDQLMANANVEIRDGAAARVREITADPTTVTARNASDALVEFGGGFYTVGDYRDFVVGQPTELRSQVQVAIDEQLDTFLSDLVRDRLLIAEAERRGITIRPLELEQVELEIKAQYESYGDALQLGSIRTQGSESMRAAISREVWSLLEGVVAGEKELLPLGPLSVPIRNHYGAQIFPAGVAAGAARVAELRTAQAEVVVPDIVAPPTSVPPAQAPSVEPAPSGGTPPAEPPPVTPSADGSPGEED